MKIESETHRLDALTVLAVRRSTSHLSGSRFRRRQSVGGDFHNVNMSGCSFDDLNMSGWRVHNVNLAGLRIEKANLAGASIVGEARGRDHRRDLGHRPARLLAGGPRGEKAHEQDHHRRQGNRRSGRIHAAPGLRSRRRGNAALLLPRAAVDRRQLPDVPGRGEGRPAEADRLLRHGGEGPAPGPERRAAGRRDQFADGAQGAPGGDGVPAHQPSARLPDLRPGRRMRPAGPGDGLWRRFVALLREQARGRGQVSSARWSRPR